MCRFIFAVFLLLSFCVNAQDFNNFKSLKSSGEVPQKFMTSSTEKYNKEVEKMSTKEQNRLRRTKKQFYLESSFIIDDMLLSGKVMFNDPVGIYINKVMDELLKNDQELRRKVEVYVIKSNEVNAFTTNNGIIFVTIGLVAQIENEAELAFILCHELTHFVNQHNLNEYVENTNIRSGRGTYRGTNLDDKLLARSNYSKKQESEADLQGLQRFLKSGYDPSTLDGVFDVLQYSHLPFDELPYKKSFIETPNLKFPSSYYLKKTKEIEASGNDDSLATHPAVKLRREAVADKVKGYDSKGKSKFIIGEKEFNTAQKQCRFEMCNVFLHYFNFEAAIYNSYLLMQDDPNSLFLKKCIGKSLYGLSKYANSDRYDEAHEDYDDVQGSSQQVYYLFDKMQHSELNVLTVAYLYSLKKQYPEDKEIAALTEDIFSELPKYYDDKSFFSTSPRPANLDSLLKADTLTKVTEETKKTDADNDDDDQGKAKSLKKKSKYDKINAEAKKKEVTSTNNYLKYAFVDLLKDPGFVSDYDKAIVTWNKKKKQKEYEETDEYKKVQTKKERREKRNGVALGLKKIVIVNPFYYKVDESKKNNPVKLVASENAQKDFNNEIKNNATLSGLNYELLDKKDLTPKSADLFNDLSVLNSYISEAGKHDDMHFVNYMTDDIQSLTKKYGTKYFDWTGIVSYREHNISASTMNLYLSCFTIFLPPLFIYAVYNSVRPHYNTYVYSEIINLETGEQKHNYVKKIKFKDRPDVVNSALYDLYLQYKKTNN